MRVRPRTKLQMHKGNDLNRWTVSFADFMTLMFAVFVVLYAVSTNNKEEYKEVILSIQNATKLLNQAVFTSDREGMLINNSNSIVENSGPALLSEGMINQANNELSDVDTLKAGWELKQLQLQLVAQFSSQLDSETIQLDLNGDWLTVEMGGDILFAGGSHTLLNSANRVIGKLASVLKPTNNLLRIRGYSDLEKVSNEIYKSNWELSGMRAFSVLHALSALGIPGEQMVVEAYGQFSPVITLQHRVDPLKSRRVVIAISKYAIVPLEINDDITEDKSLIKKVENTQATLPKEDSKEMREVYLPNNRLIITTRQE